MQIYIQKTADTIRRLIRREATSHLKKILDKTHSADIAQFTRLFTEKESAIVFGMIEDNVEKAAEVLAEMDVESAAELLEKRPPERIKNILIKMPPDDRVDIIGQLEEETADAVLQLMKKTESEEVENLLGYGESTAGGIMNTKFLALNDEITIKETVEKLQESQDIEMPFYIYVIDHRNHLVGVLSLRQLILKPPNTKLKNIMEPDVISVRLDTDQEEVARQVARYNFLAIPVVDEHNKMMGVVTVDDTIDVLREEATEDILKLAGTSTEEIREQSVISSVRRRAPWLVISLIGGFVAAIVVGRFKDFLEEFIIISFFLPVILGMGGNVGIQSTTLIVRGIATGRILIKQIWRILLKEVSVGILSGLAYGLLLFALSYVALEMGILESKNGLTAVKLGSLVGIGLFVSMFIATTFGTVIPLIFEKLKIDPALASGPFVTTAIDILGVGSYLIIASMLINS